MFGRKDSEDLVGDVHHEEVEPGFDPLSMPPKHWDSGDPVEKPLPH